MITGQSETSPAYRVKHASGTWLWFVANGARYVSTKGERQFIGVAHDMTDQKCAEEALLIQNQKFSEVLNSLDALVYVVDMKTYEIVFINTYGQNIWGDIKGKICWQTIQEGQASPCEFCTNSQLIGSDGNPTGGVVWEFQNTITKRWYDCRDRAIYWPDGRIVRMEIASDITERKRAESERMEKEKLMAVVETAGAICHEMNQPLMAISGYSELLQMQVKESGQVLEYAQLIRAQVERMGGITQKLMRITGHRTKKYLDTKILDIDGASEKLE
ncbi:MAG: PAS domain-containing protein, partial [Syntrophales bacterium LBB04]|nr:PAS domain-containing protein [Syntrophales bacterium LBB04]